MQKLKVAALGLVFALSALFSSAAQAAPTRLPTSFNPTRHVYVTPDSKVNVSGDLEQSLAQEGAQNSLAVYVAFVMQGDEALSSDFGQQSCEQVYKMWSAQQGFPKNNYLLIVIVQDKLHADHFLVGRKSGAQLARLGIKSADLDAAIARNTSVLAANPGGFVVNTLKDINKTIADARGNTNGSGNNGSGSSGTGTAGGGGISAMTWLIIGGVVVLLVGGGIFVFVTVRRKQKEAAHKRTIEKLEQFQNKKSGVETARAELSRCGLSFAPYQSRFDQAVELAGNASRTVGNDPEAAEKLADQAIGQLERLIADAGKAVTLKTDTTLGAAITAAKQEITQTRQTDVAWNYPAAPGETFPAAKYLLNEQDGNPDGFVTKAEQAQKSMLAALDAGQIPEASSAFDQAHAHCRSVSSCIKAVMAAKTRVEDGMKKLMPTVTEHDTAAADQVKQTYLAQNFTQAGKLMDTLTKLIADRTEARRLAAACDGLSKTVAEELRKHDRLVAFEVNEKVAELNGRLETLKQEVKAPTADWNALRSRAEEIQSGYEQVRTAIARAVTQHEEAGKKVREFRSELDAAKLFIRDGQLPAAATVEQRLTEVAAEKLRGLERICGELEADMKLAKKDWARILQKAGEGIQGVVDLKTMVKEDEQKWQEIASKKPVYDRLSNPDRYFVALEGRQFNGGRVLADNDQQFKTLREDALRHWKSCKLYWQNRDFRSVDGELRDLARKVTDLNLLGWWFCLQMMRDDDNFAVHHYSFQMGYRDGVTWEQWRDKFISKQRLPQDGYWVPADVGEWLRTGAGGADFTQDVDFKGFAGADPWTPPAPTPSAPPAGDVPSSN